MGGRTMPTECPHGKGGLEDAGYPAGGCLDCRYESETRNLVRVYPAEAVAQLVADGVLVERECETCHGQRWSWSTKSWGAKVTCPDCQHFNGTYRLVLDVGEGT